MKKVRLKMIGKQAEGEIVEVDTEAEYEMEGDIHLIRYTEMPKESCVATETVLRFDTTRLEIIKKGEIDSKMEFETGVRFSDDYVTPYSTFFMETVTKKWSFFINETEIFGEVLYELFIDGGKISDSEVRFWIEK